MKNNLLYNLFNDQVCSNLPLGPKMGPAQGHIFYIGLYRENMTKSTSLKVQGLEF